MALVATIGGSTSNAYTTNAVADAYFVDLLYGGEWAMFTEDQKSAGLITATALLDEFDFWGRVLSLDQRLKFPRIYTPASDGTTIPRVVIAACCELALHLLQSRTAGPIADDGEVGRLGRQVQSMSAMPQFPQRVSRLIEPWLRTAHPIDSGRNSYGVLRWPSVLT